MYIIILYSLEIKSSPSQFTFKMLHFEGEGREKKIGMFPYCIFCFKDFIWMYLFCYFLYFFIAYITKIEEEQKQASLKASRKCTSNIKLIYALNVIIENAIF